MVVAALLVVVAACSGSASSDLFGPSDGSSGGVDSGGGGGGGDSGGGGGGDSGGGGGSDAGKDAGVVVHEEPAPLCNDLTQLDPFVVPVANPSAPPAPNPPPTIDPGLYVASSIVEYETSQTQEPPQKITVAVTATRYFYLYDTGSQHLPVTTDWSLADGTLTRTILCEPGVDAGTIPVVKNRVDQAADGYIVWARSRLGNPLAVRYTRSN